MQNPRIHTAAEEQHQGGHPFPSHEASLRWRCAELHSAAASLMDRPPNFCLKQGSLESKAREVKDKTQTARSRDVVGCNWKPLAALALLIPRRCDDQARSD